MSDELCLRGVRAGYGESVVLEGIDLTVPRRSACAVLGRNGVGKTTLLTTIMGHTTLHDGTIEHLDVPITSLPIYERSRRGIGLVPQSRGIFPSLDVEENLLVAAREGRWTIEKVFELFPNLAARRRNMGNQLSGGEQQMLAIGRALVGNPSLLLMDEPLEGLAPVIVQSLFVALRRLIEDGSLTIVIVEQHAKLVLQLTQHAIVLNRGKIEFSGSSSELLSDHKRLTRLISAHETEQ